ncbi:MAG: molybdopterin-binding protein, partial [Actinomycetota bacterium]|nr:molybdopterin-binding protein [Actinomycetota bacterium]
MKTAILTISTSVAAGRSEDTSGELLAELARAAGAKVVVQDIVSDDRAAIEAALRRYVEEDAALVFTTGGTGLT